MGIPTQKDAAELLTSFEAKKKDIKKHQEEKKQEIILKTKTTQKEVDQLYQELSEHNKKYDRCVAIIKRLNKLVNLYASIEEMRVKRYPTKSLEIKINDLNKQISKELARESI